MFWISKSNKAVQCQLCAHNCSIPDGKTGICKIRVNKNGKLYTSIYGLVSPGMIDPIEKKPLYHFHPGTRAYSFGSVSCNFKCSNCQNWHISQITNSLPIVKQVPPKSAIELALQKKCNGIAWTYNEPTIWFEYTYFGSKLAKKHNLYTVYVTNGFINPEPLKKIAPYLDALNIDVKAFSNDFYRKICKGRLEPVIRTAELSVQFGKHVEITNLVIPTMNDKPDEFKQLAKWVYEKLGPDTPLHFSRFHPNNKMQDLPVTPEKTLISAHKIAKEIGLKFVFLGNIYHPRHGNTYCPNCNHLVIRRGSTFGVKSNNLINGRCKTCNEKILNYP